MNRFRYSAETYQALENNQRHKFAQNHALMLYRANALYSFIPKNACSTMRYSLALYNGCIENEVDVHWIHQNNGTFRATLRDSILADYSFVILRCPFRRLVSVFLDKFVDKNLPAWNYYEAVNRQTELEDLTFRGFVQSLKKPKLLRMNKHWRPQIDFLLFQQYSDTFCVENFSRAVETLENKLGFPIHDVRHLTGHGRDAYEEVKDDLFGDVPVGELAVMKREGKLPRADRMFDEKLYSMAGEIYGPDIELYRETLSDGNLLESP